MPRITKVALVGLVMVAIVLGFFYGLYGLGGSAVQAQGETGTCPNAQQIDEFTGTGNQTSDAFETTSNSLRLSYELTSTGDLDLGEPSLIIGVRDAEEDIPVASASQDGSGTGESFVNEPPGNYFLDINLVGEGQYTVTVEQCESGDPPNTNPTPGTQKESSQPKASSPAPKTPATPPKTPSPAPKTPSPAPKTPAPAPKDSGTLMNAGGPTTGPVLMMPNGSCPREFPTIRDGACYSG